MYDAPPDSPFENETQTSSNPLEGIQSLLQKHGKTILMLIIIGVIAFFVYDYFIGSQVKLTITARDTEGKILSTMRGALFEAGAASPIQGFEGSTTLGVRPGNYRVEWDAEGTVYVPPETVEIVVEKNTEMEQEETTRFVKDLGVTLVSADFPTAIVRGQRGAQGMVKLKNSTNAAQTIELALDEGLTVFKDSITFEPATVTVPAKGTLDVRLTLDVPDTLNVANKNTGDKKTGSIRIKYTEEKIEKTFTQYYSFTYDVTPKQTITITAKADEQKTAKFTMGTNSANESNEKINAQVTLTQTDNTNLESEIKTWFTWAIEPPLTPPKKGEKIYPEIRFRAPVTAQGDIIQGQVRFYTSFWEQLIPFTITLTEAAIDIVGTIDGTKTKTYTLRKDTANPTIYQFQTATLKIENKSAFPISAILYELTTGCEEYISLISPDFFPIQNLPERGKAGAVQSTQVKINSPSTALPGSEKICEIKLTYEDPRTNEPTDLQPSMVVQVNT